LRRWLETYTVVLVSHSTLCRIAALLIPPDDREFVLGDLEEMYVRRVSQRGEVAATAWYVRALLASAIARRFRRISRPCHGSDRYTSRRNAMLSDVIGDLRIALRTLARRPGFTLLAVATLGLGVGAAGAVFGMVNQILLRPLPGVRDDGRLAYLEFRSVEDPTRRIGIPPVDFPLLREGATTVEAMAATGRMSLHVTREGGRPVVVPAQTIDGAFFEALGVGPVRGRLLRAEETGIDADPLLAVISERLWSTYFDRADDVAGRILVANGHPVIVVGVAGGGFAGVQRGDEVDLWLPMASLVPLLGFTPETMRSQRWSGHDNLVVRLRPGVSAQVAEAELAQVLARVAASNPDMGEALAAHRPTLFPGLHTTPMMRERTLTSLGILSGAVLLVLLIACANLSNLLLFRGVQRRGDVAVRRALGASGARVARQLLVESAVLATLGVMTGLAAAWAIAFAFRGERLMRMPAFEGFTLDWRVLVFAGLAVLITAVLAGALPALLAGRFDLAGAMRAAGRQETGRQSAIRATITTLQIAVSLSLLIGGLLLTRTVVNLHRVDLGLRTDNVHQLTIHHRRSYAGPAAEVLHRRLLDAVQKVAGVEAAALDVYGPFSASMSGIVRLPSAPSDERNFASMTNVTPGWFELFGVEPVSGRAFRAEDWDAAAPPRIIITESVARRFFGDAQATGRTLVTGFAEPSEREIVGIVPDTRLLGPRADAAEVIYFPFMELPLSYVTILFRTAATSAATVAAVQHAVEGVAPDLPVPDPALLTARIDAQVAEQRLFARLLSLFSGLAILLAAVGLYGVLAVSVASRTREFGIRRALGARGERIIALVFRHGALITGLGLALGLAGAWALSRVLESRLFGIEPVDVPTYAVAAAFFAAVAALACWVPSRAATRVDPMVALRHE
jgi:putative ABC transport system permease protein